MNNTLFKLISSESIGNTLSSLNSNYETMDVILTNIQTSAINLWLPMMKIYESKKNDWKTAAKEIKNKFPEWEYASTTFEENSAKWLTPIISWYPCILEYKLTQQNPSEVQEKKISWLNTQFPILNKSGSPNYVETQKIIVYSLNYSQDIPTKEVFELFDGTMCTTSDQKVCSYCSKCYHGGGIQCNNGGFTCGGCSNCSVCETVDCFFDNGLTEKSSQIAASLTINYQNKYEQPEINAFVFKVEDCKWVFDSVLAVP